MPKEEWGVKRLCPTTGKRFYDLNKTPIISPYTGEVVELNTAKGRMISSDTQNMKAKSDDVDDDDLLLDDDDVDVDIDDELLEDEDDENVSLDDIADVAGDDDM